MRVRWFGQPWPQLDQRAPICADDRFRIDAPLGERCVGCGNRIESGDRGVVMAAGAGSPDSWQLNGVWVVAEHLNCLVATVIPDHG